MLLMPTNYSKNKIYEKNGYLFLMPPMSSLQGIFRLKYNRPKFSLIFLCRYNIIGIYNMLAAMVALRNPITTAGTRSPAHYNLVYYNIIIIVIGQQRTNLFRTCIHIYMYNLYLHARCLPTPRVY